MGSPFWAGDAARGGTRSLSPSSYVVCFRLLLSSSSCVGAHFRFWRITQENGLSLRPEMAPWFRLSQPSCPLWCPSCLCFSLLSPFLGTSRGGRGCEQAVRRLRVSARLSFFLPPGPRIVSWGGATRGGAGQGEVGRGGRGGARGVRRRRDQSASARDTGCKTGRAFPKCGTSSFTSREFPLRPARVFSSGYRGVFPHMFI